MGWTGVVIILVYRVFQTLESLIPFEDKQKCSLMHSKQLLIVGCLDLHHLTLSDTLVS